MKHDSVPFAEKTLWAGALKATMRATLLAQNFVELETCVGGEVPHIYTGTISAMISRGDIWLACRKAEGFEEQLPNYNHEAVRV